MPLIPHERRQQQQRHRRRIDDHLACRGLVRHDDDYAARAFEFFRAFAGYMWTTRRGTFVTLRVAGQVTLNPAATAYNFLWGPALGITYRVRSAPAETPPAPPDVEIQ